MSFELVKEKYAGPVNALRIGRPGLKSGLVMIGGETALPFMFQEGAMPNKPVVALEIFDSEPADWPAVLKREFGRAIKDPGEWAADCVSRHKAKALCIRLQSIHPDFGNRSSDEAILVLKNILNRTGVPLIVVGCGDDDKDNDVLPKASQALKGENCLFGIATQSNYKTLAATCLADGHSIIAESPIDCNIAKQLNILITDMGFDPSRIVMHPTTTALGYGMEYVYSIMERSRLAAFIGDRSLAMPFVLFVGQETWKVKEARDFGDEQGINWEVATSAAMLQAGVDIIVVRHPRSARLITEYIDILIPGLSGRGK